MKRHAYILITLSLGLLSSGFMYTKLWTECVAVWGPYVCKNPLDPFSSVEIFAVASILFAVLWLTEVCTIAYTISKLPKDHSD